MPAFALQNIHFSNVRFWREADIEELTSVATGWPAADNPNAAKRRPPPKKAANPRET